jgi:hypothetical protein
MSNGGGHAHTRACTSRTETDIDLHHGDVCR